MKLRKQKGFAIASFGVFLLMVSLVLTYGLTVYAKKNKDIIDVNRAEQVGERMAVIGDAVKTYATHYFVQVQKGESAKAIAGTYEVPADRVRNPTLNDLYQLGIITSEEVITPIVFRDRSISFDVAFTVNATGCVIPSCSIEAVIKSTQPLMNEVGTQADVRLATVAAVAASKENAGVTLLGSMGADPAEFVKIGGGFLAVNSSGIEGLIALKTAYDSRGFMEFDRRDGSLPRTGALRLKDDTGQKHDITGAATVEVGEFLDLSAAKVAVPNAGCSKTGLVSRDVDGKLLSCQSGIWKKAESVGFGGSFMTQANGGPHIGYSTFCAVANPATGACSCPDGTSAHWVSNGMGWAYSQWDRVWSGYTCLGVN